MKSSPLKFTVLTLKPGKLAGKRFGKGSPVPDRPNLGSLFRAREVTFDADLLRTLRQERLRCLCLGAPAVKNPKDWHRRNKETYADVARGWMPVDVDAFSPDDLTNDISDGESAARDIVDWLDLRGVDVVWHVASSHGLKVAKNAKEKPRLKVSVHLYVRLSSPLTCVEMKRVAKRLWGDKVDLSIYDPERVFYTYDPVLDGLDDPVVGERVGSFAGEDLVVDNEAERDADDEGDDRSHVENKDEDDADPVLVAIREEGLYREDMGKGKHWIECPWAEHHTQPAARGGTVYFEAGNGNLFPQFDCKHSHCEGKKISHLRRKLGVRDDELRFPGWAYIRLRKQYWNEELRELVDKEVFESYAMADVVKKKSKVMPHVLFLGSQKTKKFDAMHFKPGAPTVVYADNKRWLNVYADRRIVPEKGDVTPWVEHLEWCVPDDDERRHLMDWIAWTYQHPGQKITWAPILYSAAHGVGKTTIFDVLAECIGRAHVSEPTQSELEDKFTDWAFGKLLVKIEELMSGDKLHVAEKLKPVVANPTVSIRRMHQTGFSVPNFANVCASTNHMQALRIERGDRRYMMIQCVEASLEERRPRMRAFHAWLEEAGHSGIAWWLANRDVSRFVPTGEAPMTRLKRVVIDATATAFDRAVNLCEEFDKEDFVSSGVIEEYLQANGLDASKLVNQFGGIALRRRWKKPSEVATGLPDRVRIEGRRVSFWLPKGKTLPLQKFLAKRPDERDREYKSAIARMKFSEASSDV